MIAVAARDPLVADNLWREASSQEPGKQRQELFEGLVAGSLLRGGPEAVDASLGRIENMSAQERNQLVATLSQNFVLTDGAWAMMTLPSIRDPLIVLALLPSGANGPFP